VGSEMCIRDSSITGRTLNEVIALPRAVLQDNNTLWINRDNTLDIRPVTLAWKDRENVYVASGVTPGEAVITSGLSVPVQGMPLKTEGIAKKRTFDTVPSQSPEAPAQAAGESK